MQLSVTWLEPIKMKVITKTDKDYQADLDRVPRAPGIYIFGRLWGKNGFEALYVGKANKLYGRVTLQFNNLKLMKHIKTARSGKRILLIGLFAAKPGQQTKACLPIIERAFIRHFLSEGHDLVNIQGTLIRRHELTSSGKKSTKLFPKSIFVDRGKRE